MRTELTLSSCSQENPAAPPKALDLSNELLSRGAVEALSDLLAIDFGLKKLTLDHCGLDDEVRSLPLTLSSNDGASSDSSSTCALQSLRPLLHALLVSASIPTVSLAGNKRIRARGWKFIATFLRKVRPPPSPSLALVARDAADETFTAHARRPLSCATST